MRSGVSYSVRIKASAAKELERIPGPARLRIIAAIDGLGEQPLVGAPLKGGLRGLRRQRVGDYRIVYELFLPERATMAEMPSSSISGCSCSTLAIILP